VETAANQEQGQNDKYSGSNIKINLSPNFKEKNAAISLKH